MPVDVAAGARRAQAGQRGAVDRVADGLAERRVGGQRTVGVQREVVEHGFGTEQVLLVPASRGHAVWPVASGEPRGIWPVDLAVHRVVGRARLDLGDGRRAGDPEGELDPRAPVGAAAVGLTMLRQ